MKNMFKATLNTLEWLCFGVFILNFQLLLKIWINWNPLLVPVWILQVCVRKTLHWPGSNELFFMGIILFYFQINVHIVINSFYTAGLFLNHLKTSKNIWLSDDFRVYRKRLVTWNRL